MGYANLDLAALELLVGVEVHGSVGAASRRARLAQPNASRSLQRLERRLGVRLIDRRPSGSVLTAHGTVIAHWARRVLSEAEGLVKVAEGLRADAPVRLTVGASITVAEHLMPRWLMEFRGEHPEMSIHLQAHNSSLIFDLVSTSKCDIGFIETPLVPRGLHSVVIAKDELIVVVHPSHPWTRRRRALTATDLASTSLLVRERGSGTRTTLDLALREFDCAEPLLELGSAAAIRASVLDGVGPAVMSNLAVAEQLRSGQLQRVQVEGIDLTRELRAVWRSPRKLEGPPASLVRMIQRSTSS